MDPSMLQQPDQSSGLDNPCSWSTVVFDLRRSVSNLVLYVLESMPIPWIFPPAAGPAGNLTVPPAVPSARDSMDELDAWLDQTAAAPAEPPKQVEPTPPPLMTAAAPVKVELLPPPPTKPKKPSTASKRKTPAAAAPAPSAGAALDALVQDTLA